MCTSLREAVLHNGFNHDTSLSELLDMNSKSTNLLVMIIKDFLLLFQSLIIFNQAMSEKWYALNLESNISNCTDNCSARSKEVGFPFYQLLTPSND